MVFFDVPLIVPQEVDAITCLESTNHRWLFPEILCYQIGKGWKFLLDSLSCTGTSLEARRYWIIPWSFYIIMSGLDKVLLRCGSIKRRYWCYLNNRHLYRWKTSYLFPHARHLSRSYIPVRLVFDCNSHINYLLRMSSISSSDQMDTRWLAWKL